MPKSELPEGYKLIRKQRAPTVWSKLVGTYLKQGYSMAEATKKAKASYKGGARPKKAAKKPKRVMRK